MAMTQEQVEKRMEELKVADYRVDNTVEGGRRNLGADVYDAYVRGFQRYGQNYSNETVYFQGHTIYSYGNHFPMAIRMNSPKEGEWYLVNGERYSNTTSKHQSDLRQALQYKRSVIIPFIALSQAGIIKESLELIDVQEDQYITKYRYDKETGEKIEYQAHLLGASLFKAVREHWENGFTREEGYFLSGLDETGRDPWNAYFLAQLDLGYGKPESVDEAYECLKPMEVIKAERREEVVERQGEWFFIRVDEDMQTMLRTLEKDGEKERKKTGEESVIMDDVMYERNGFLQNRDENRPTRHKCTRIIQIENNVFVRGTVRHTDGDHKMLKLEGGWYEVHENTQLRGWSVDGSVD